jgi:protease-4
MGKHAGMESIIRDFTPEEHQRFEAMLDQVYAGFKDRVAQGRKLSADAVEAVAKGRVWTGEDAKAHGLVDELGGFATALALAKSAAGIDAKSDVTLKVFPPTSNTPGAVIARLLGRETRPEDARSSAALARVLSALGPAIERIEAAVDRPGALVMPEIELR